MSKIVESPATFAGDLYTLWRIVQGALELGDLEDRAVQAVLLDTLDDELHDMRRDHGHECPGEEAGP